MSRLDRIGVWIETSMTSFFTGWGTLCARYPVPVIVLSVGFAAGLCTGMRWLQVETDPIELWAAPSSRSRVEKDFYDSVFRPFYRTQQVIVSARNIEPVSDRKESVYRSVRLLRLASFCSFSESQKCKAEVGLDNNFARPFCICLFASDYPINERSTFFLFILSSDSLLL